MHNHNNILQQYFACFNKHIENVSQFQVQTKRFLRYSNVSDFFYENLGRKVIKSTLTESKISNVDKILIITEEVAKDGKSYLDKISFLKIVLGDLISIVVKNTE